MKHPGDKMGRWYLLQNRTSYAGMYLAGVGLVLILFIAAIDWMQGGHSSYVGLLLLLFSGDGRTRGDAHPLRGLAEASPRRSGSCPGETPRSQRTGGPAEVPRPVCRGGGAPEHYRPGHLRRVQVHGKEFLLRGALPHHDPRIRCLSVVSPCLRRMRGVPRWPRPLAFSEVQARRDQATGGPAPQQLPDPHPTPVESLRPARAVCEHCHWPGKFFGTKLVQRPYFHPDEKNTAEQITLGVKIGGRIFASIHYGHIIGVKQMDYFPADREEQEIPWVGVTRLDGTTEEYLSLDYKGPDRPFAVGPGSSTASAAITGRPTSSTPRTGP